MSAARHPVNHQPPRSPTLQPGERTGATQINGLRLHWREWGSRDAPTLVLLHGLRGFSGTWRVLARHLDKEYHLVALDQRGRGDSDWDPDHNYYTDAYLCDLEIWLDRLGVDRFFLLGHSMGGATAYVYAHRHPERLRALIIEDIAPGSSTQSLGARRIVSEMANLPETFESWGEARGYWRALRPSLSAEAIEQRLAESLREGAGGKILWRYDAAGIRHTRMHPDSDRIVDLWPLVLGITTPTLVIRGEHSDFCSSDVMASVCMRNAKVECIAIPDAGHYVHDDSPELFARHVRTFMLRHA